MTISDLKQQALDLLQIHPDYDWMLSVFAIVLLTGFASLIVGIVLGQFVKRLSRTKTQWDDIVAESMRRPARALVWVFGLSEALQVVMARSDLAMDISENVGGLRDVAIVIMIAWGLLRFIRRGKGYYISSKQEKGESYDLTTVMAVSKLLNISVIITTVLITLQTLGISISALLAAGGMGGIAIGFAAKDMLANFFGALIIYFDKPFKVGDWIRSPDKEIEGTVEEIGWRMTTIRTFDKRPLYVPNSAFTTISVENPSRMTSRRINETIGIRYDDIAQMADIVADVKQMLIDHPDIDDSQTLIVNFNAFSASSCDFFIYTFTHTTDWVEFHGKKQDVLLKIADIIAARGAEMAFPTQTIHVESMVEAS